MTIYAEKVFMVVCKPCGLGETAMMPAVRLTKSGKDEFAA